MIECPMFDTTCPYCDDEGMCKMKEIEGCSPFDECEEFYDYDND